MKLNKCHKPLHMLLNIHTTLCARMVNLSPILHLHLPYYNYIQLRQDGLMPQYLKSIIILCFYKIHKTTIIQMNKRLSYDNRNIYFSFFLFTNPILAITSVKKFFFELIRDDSLGYKKNTNNLIRFKTERIAIVQ